MSILTLVKSVKWINTYCFLFSQVTLEVKEIIHLTETKKNKSIASMFEISG